MAGSATAVGDIIGGRYRIVDKAGEGGMSIVWDARDTKMNTRRAIKEVKKHSNDAQYRVNVNSLKQEAEMMKGLNHPLLPKIFDIIEEDNRLFVVMDYIEGLDLSQVLKRRVSAIPEELVIDWGIQLCEAMQYLHTSVIDETTGRPKCIVYRDMKPGNVKLLDDGTVRIFDFGIAREYSVEKSDDTMALGTRGYASPEAFKKGNQTDPRSDIYSLGVTLFHLVTGFGPIKFVDQPNLPPIRSINPSLSEGLEAIIIKCTQWNPDLRYQSCNEMRYDLEHYTEIGNDRRRELQKKVTIFKGLAIAGIACLVLGIGTMVGSTLLKGSSYDGLVEQAAAAVNSGESEQAEELYTQAISVDPGRADAYLGLVDAKEGAYASDGDFTQEEASAWNDIYKNNQGSLERLDSYAEICYDVGKLYFSQYSYGDELSQTSSSVTWFQRAIDAGAVAGSGFDSTDEALAEVYVTIGTFSQTVQASIQEGTEQEDYVNLWNALESGVGNETGSNLAQLSMYSLAYSTINSESLLPKFKGAGISESRVTSLLSEVYEKTRAIDSGSVPEKMQEDYEAIINGYESAQNKIEAVYNNSGSGNTGSGTRR